MTNDPFFDQLYRNRQLILFVDDTNTQAQGNFFDVFKATLNEKVAERKKRYYDVSRLLMKPFLGSVVPQTPDHAKKVAEPSLLEHIFLGGFWLDTRVIGEAQVDTIRGAKSQGVENLQLVGKSKIPLFEPFPPGHPRDRTVYAGHPGIPKKYIPLADFHRFIFEHKFVEVISLLTHLGAKTIKVEHVTGQSIEFASHLGGSIPAVLAGSDVGIKGGFKRGNERTLLYHATLNNKRVPELPANLVWYPFEATWQQLVNDRMNSGLNHFILHLNYNDDYGINGNLKFKLEKAGLELGGSFEEHTATTWHISGDFQ